MPTMPLSSRKSTKPRVLSRSQHGRRNALPPGSAFFFRRQETLRVFPDFCRHLLEIVDGDVTSSRMLDCSSSARGTRGKARGKAAAELRSPRRSIHDRSELPDYRRAGATRRRDGAHHPVLRPAGAAVAIGEGSAEPAPVHRRQRERPVSHSDLEVPRAVAGPDQIRCSSLPRAGSIAGVGRRADGCYRRAVPIAVQAHDHAALPA